MSAEVCVIKRIFGGESGVVILEVVEHAHDGTVVTGTAAWVERLEAHITESNHLLSAIICGVRHFHVLQVILNLIQLQTNKQLNITYTCVCMCVTLFN